MFSNFAKLRYLYYLYFLIFELYIIQGESKRSNMSKIFVKTFSSLYSRYKDNTLFSKKSAKSKEKN